MATNPYKNKIIYNGQTLIDLTGDTIEPDKLLEGYTAHDASGAPIVGIAPSGSGSAVSVVDTQDSGGGTIRTITAVSLAGDTVAPSNLLTGYTAHNSLGQPIVGTASSGGDFTAEELANKTVSGVLNFGTATDIRQGLFNGCGGITGIVGNSLTSIAGDAFRDARIVDPILPELVSIGGFGISGVLGDVYLPKLTTITGGYPFSYSPNGAEGKPAVDLTIVLPKLTTISADVFRRCHAKYIDLGSDFSVLANRTFYQSSTDTVLILRNPNQVVTATASNCLYGVRTTWKVYVPSALLNSYENDANWGVKGSIFYAIEGSQFDGYYADGRAIPST